MKWNNIPQVHSKVAVHNNVAKRVRFKKEFVKKLFDWESAALILPYKVVLAASPLASRGFAPRENYKKKLSTTGAAASSFM